MVDVWMEPVLGVATEAERARTRFSSKFMDLFKQSWYEEASTAGVGDAYDVHRGEALS
jgi:hypothetical protein